MISFTQGQPPLEELREFENIIVIINNNPYIAFMRKTFDKRELLQYVTWERLNEEYVTKWARIEDVPEPKNVTGSFEYDQGKLRALFDKENGAEPEPEQKYYFISYLHGVRTTNGVINIHPLLWQDKTEGEYPDQYVLLNWNEITKKEYDKFLEWS